MNAPFADAPAGNRFVSVNGNSWLVSYMGRTYVRRAWDDEWYGPSDKVYSTEELISNGWRPA